MSKRNATKLSIIDTDVRIEGKITGKGRLIIKGTVDGRIEGETVIIAEEGCVSSDAMVSSITISGTFDGAIEADGQVVITSTGKCAGRISCKDIVVENGGALNAEVNSTGQQRIDASDNRKKNGKPSLEDQKGLAGEVAT